LALVRITKEKPYTRTDTLTFVLLTCISAPVIVVFLERWFSFNDRNTGRLPFVILTFILLFKVANSLARWFTLPFMRRPRAIVPKQGLRVAVVTTIVPGAESLEMLEETVRALVALDYSHETWVLDEGDDEEVRALCRRCGAMHFSRRNLPRYRTESGTFTIHSKHGNYNAWLFEIGFARYEIIAAFDPDHVPAPSFLTHVVGYFEDPSVGYVQAPQAYYNQQATFIARGAAEETYEYYSCTQMAAYGLGQPNVVGCHNTHRVTALRAVGGFAPHDADDLLTGLLYQTHGWNGVYVPRILARGVTPVDWNGYLTQQQRWARSVIDIKIRMHHFLGKKLPPVAQAISVLHGLFYIQNGLTSLAGFLLLVYLLVTGDVPSVVSYDILPWFVLLCATLQACAFYRQRFYLNPSKEWGLHPRAALLQYAKWPVLILALWDVAVGRRVPYVLTRKVRAESRRSVLVMSHGMIAMSVFVACGIGMLLSSHVPSLVYWVAAVVVSLSVSLILTDQLHFPAPYDKRWLASDQQGGRQHFETG